MYRKKMVVLSLAIKGTKNAIHSCPGRKSRGGIVVMLCACMIAMFPSSHPKFYVEAFSFTTHSFKTSTTTRTTSWRFLFARSSSSASTTATGSASRLFGTTNNNEDTTTTTTTATVPSTSSATSQNRRRPNGVTEFEEWFTKLDHPKASVHPAVQHERFSSSSSSNYLRGLSWDSDYVMYSKNKIATIPGDVVLSSKYTNNEHWDRDLALELWHEMQKPNRTSSIWGYCALLGQGNDWKNSNRNPNHNNEDPVPPSTAPHALRHWTTPQKERLKNTPAGQALLELNQRQQEQWKQKYRTNPPTSCTESQFEWAMEVVHSRAFCGIPTNPLQDLPYLLAPILAAGVGYWYATTTTMMDPSSSSGSPWEDPVLMTLALGSVALTALSLTKKDTKWAVLLPLIDSANHMDNADSVIDYDPLRKCFELTVGPSSFVEEPVYIEKEMDGDRHHSQKEPPPQLGKPQVYISYGKKGDAEWLLNYGFLPGIRPLDPDDDDDDAYRRRLAEAYMGRNKN